MIHSIQGIGSGKLRRLIARFGNACTAWHHLVEEPGSTEDPWLLQISQKLKELDSSEVEERLHAQGINIVIPEEDGYPELLRQLADAPPLLYYKGQLSPSKESLAIVGARKATPYGRAAAEALAKEIAEERIVVVSGLARGIDTAAHRGALAGQGITWAVMGCGLSFMYPPENQKLSEEIMANQGLLWSEFAPETPPEPQFFPARNRLISGMSRGVVVVEAALKSGALITVDFALEQGREVFAVPGPIFSQMSRGPNHLIRQGAKLIEGFQDICSEIPAFTEGRGSSTPKETNSIMSTNNGQDKKKPQLSSEQEKVLEMLSDLPCHIDQITLNAKIAPELIPLVLLELQLAGRIEQLPGQLYVLAYKS
ncbi:DNA-processing protein DprA [Desulfitobacterium sp. THU1]|uniref:DNA-processing protein DprA n=1 Tax=Desulfitobacterium sp. THU1 TaxID=3138072 RepID=UPI00311D859A